MGKTSSEAPQIRELFIEELAGIHGGSSAMNMGDPYTTQACCEEGPFGCCDILPIEVGP